MIVLRVNIKCNVYSFIKFENREKIQKWLKELNSFKKSNCRDKCVTNVLMTNETIVHIIIYIYTPFDLYM